MMDNDPELIQLAREYCDTAVELTAQLQEHVLAMETADAPEAHIHAAFRLAHNMKGSGGTAGVPVISQICGPVEDELERLRSGASAVTPGVIGRLLKYVDQLAAAARAGAAGATDLDKYAALTAALAAPPAAAAKPPAAGKNTIIVAETSTLYRRIVADFLRRHNCEVLETDNGVDVLALLGRQRVGAVITGLDLKALSGHALTAAIKTDSVFSAVKVIYLTSQSTAYQDARCKPDGLVGKDAHLEGTLRKMLLKLGLLPEQSSV